MAKAGGIVGATGGLFVGGAFSGVGSLPGALIGGIGGAAVGAGREYYRQNYQQPVTSASGAAS